MVFKFFVLMSSIKEPPGTFYLGGCILCHIFYNRQMRVEIAWVTTVRRLINQSGRFQNTPKFNWQPMEFLCQLTCQSADIMSSLCGVGVRVRVNNFSSETTRPRDVLFFLKDTLSIEDEKLFNACKSVCSSVC